MPTLSRGALQLFPVGGSLYFSWARNEREFRVSSRGQVHAFFTRCCGLRREVKWAGAECHGCGRVLNTFGLYGYTDEWDKPSSWADWLFGDDLDPLTHGLVVPQLEDELVYLPEPWGRALQDARLDSTRAAADLQSWLARLDGLDLT